MSTSWEHFRPIFFSPSPRLDFQISLPLRGAFIFSPTCRHLFFLIPPSPPHTHAHTRTISLSLPTPAPFLNFLNPSHWLIPPVSPCSPPSSLAGSRYIFFFFFFLTPISPVLLLPSPCLSQHCFLLSCRPTPPEPPSPRRPQTSSLLPSLSLNQLLSDCCGATHVPDRLASETRGARGGGVSVPLGQLTLPARCCAERLFRGGRCG